MTQPTQSTVPATTLRAENARLRVELAQLRRELDNAHAALAWIDSLQALDALNEIDDLDDTEVSR